MRPKDDKSSAKDSIKNYDPRAFEPPHPNLKKAIASHAMTQESFAAAMGTNGTRVSRWVNGSPDGRATECRLSNSDLARAALMLGVSPTHLLGINCTISEWVAARERIRKYWAISKDPNRVAGEVYQEEKVDDPSVSRLIKVRALEKSWLTHEVSLTHGAPQLTTVTYDCNKLFSERENAKQDFNSWCQDFKKDKANELKNDLLSIPGDWRDPLAVYAELLRLLSGSEGTQDRYAEALEAMDSALFGNPKN